jgi:hypothetical protein
MALGLTHKNMDPNGFPSLIREDVLLPIAADVDYFSSATDGGAQGAKDISASVAGDSIFRSATGKRPLFYARRPTITTVDNSGTTLAVTVRLTCRRFGRTFTQDIVAAAGVGSQTVAGSRVCDEVVAAKIVSIAANAASDTLSIGFDDSWIGLHYPIKDLNSVCMVYKIAAGTPDANGPKKRTDLTAAMINASANVNFFILKSPVAG